MALVEAHPDMLTTSHGQERVQERLSEMFELIDIVLDGGGTADDAMNWYVSQPIPALGGLTSQKLVNNGRASAAKAYLEHIRLGGYA